VNGVLTRNAALLRLTAGDVHVALAEFADTVDPGTVGRCLSLLNADEHARYERFIPPRTKLEFLITHALARTELSRFADVRPEEWRFKTGSHGRPEIDGDIVRELGFNLSNTRGLVACAVTRGADVGVDVEDTTLKRQTVEVAERFFSPEEVKALRSLPSELQRDRFFDYWTLKESYIKARGLGLAIPLERFSFHLNPGEPIRIELDPSLGDDARTWRFWLDRPTQAHRLAVALRCGVGEEPRYRQVWVRPQDWFAE
jgi:4'-phosphopantetheinyl transferase